MTENEPKPIHELLASGAIPSTLRSQAKGSGNDLVTVQDWQACFGSNGLVESCTVNAKEAGNFITSVGMLAYSADDQTLYCSQFTAGLASASLRDYWRIQPPGWRENVRSSVWLHRRS
jgi:hypothetical protein